MQGLEQVADIVIRNNYARTLAIVEVKNPKNLPIEDINAYYADLRPFAIVTAAIYSLLISQDVAFLWQTDKTDAPEQPILQFSMPEVIKRYLPDRDLLDDRLYNVQLQFLVFQWLNELGAGIYDVSQEPEKSLYEVGFLKVIEDSIALFSVAV